MVPEPPVQNRYEKMYLARYFFVSMDKTSCSCREQKFYPRIDFASIEHGVSDTVYKIIEISGI